MPDNSPSEPSKREPPGSNPAEARTLSGAEMGAIAHLYRAEVGRATIWGTRLDTTTNWAVVTLGVALSISFATPDASPVPLMLAGLLLLFLLWVEAVRYRYFNVWRARARWMEENFYAPMLKDGDLRMEQRWQVVLADDYLKPQFHVSLWMALGRRIRRNYLWILLIQGLAYALKLAIHPIPAAGFSEFAGRAALGPIPGWVILSLGAGYCLALGGLAVWSMIVDEKTHGDAHHFGGMG